MRFLRKSLMGLFLFSMTIGLLVFAADMVRTALGGEDGNGRRGGGPRERTFAVNVVEFVPGPQTPILQVFGEVQSRRILDIRPAVGGTVVELNPNFVDGGLVRKGAILLRLDASDAETALALVQADMADAEAEQREAKRALSLAQDEVVAAQEQADLRLKALQRQNDLVQRGVATEAAVEVAELAASSAKQAVLSRRQGLQSVEARLDQANSRLTRIKISIAEAQRRLRDTVLVADFDGALTQVTVGLGGKVTGNERIGQLVDPGALEVAFRVSTRQHARLLTSDGQLRRSPVTTSLDVAGASSVGTLDREAAVVGEGLTGRLLFATLDQAGGLRPGDFVRVEIAETPLDRVARLPASALSGSNMVLVMGDEGRLSERAVDLIRRQGDDVLVRARGLRGASIVAERTPLLGAGIKVRALNSDPDAPIEAPAMVSLTPERLAKLIAFVEGNTRMPAAAKERVLGILSQPEVPQATVDRLESRMGG
ncbi:MAG: efflux RND transporter periplasmic adaptor subunit [Planktomarina sp.]